MPLALASLELADPMGRILMLDGLALTTPAGAQLAHPVRNGEQEHATFRTGRDQLQLAAMGTHELSGNRKSKPGAARPRRAVESFEQLAAYLLGNARTRVADLDRGDRSVAPGLES